MGSTSSTAATLAFMAALFVGLSLQPVRAAQRPDPRREPATAIAEAIRLLERKDYVALLENFARPDELKAMLAKKPIEELAADFGQRRAAGTLDALKAASRMTPELSQDGLRADYRFEKPVGGENRVRLVRIGEYWFLR